MFVCLYVCLLSLCIVRNQTSHCDNKRSVAFRAFSMKSWYMNHRKDVGHVRARGLPDVLNDESQWWHGQRRVCMRVMGAGVMCVKV